MGHTGGVRRVVIPPGVHPWPHEMRVVRILFDAGHTVEFLPTGVLKTADILVDGVEFEIKSPLTSKPDKLERAIKRALRQSKNIIYDSSRIKGMPDTQLRRFLSNKAKTQPQIGRLILITKLGKIVDIK